MREWTDADEGEAAIERELDAPLAALRSHGRGCPDPALWPALEGGVLPESLATPAAEHLRECQVCQALAGDLASDDMTSAVEANPVALPPPPALPRKAAAATPSRWGWLLRPLPAAAGLLVALAAASAWWMTGGPQASVRAPAAPAPASGPVRAEPPSYRLSLEKPPVVVPLGTALVWRSDSASEHDQYLADLAAALVPYRNDEFGEAAVRLLAVTRRHPTAEAWFYLGVSRLLLGESHAAVGDLRRARELAQPPLRDDASWYLAVALERAGAAEAAVPELKALCAGGGARRARACEALGGR
jgi:hypothetical protein